MAQHNMVSLRRPKSEQEDEAVEVGSNEFPLNLYVTTPELEKLGLSKAKIGEEHDLFAKIKVTSVSVDEHEGSEKHESVTLPLLEGEVGSDHGSDHASRAKKLFDED